jgi:hypothetical protein
MIEGSGSGTITLSDGPGSGSRRPKNMWIRWIRIRIHNTDGGQYQCRLINIQQIPVVRCVCEQKRGKTIPGTASGWPAEPKHPSTSPMRRAFASEFTVTPFRYRDLALITRRLVRGGLFLWTDNVYLREKHLWRRAERINTRIGVPVLFLLVTFPFIEGEGGGQVVSRQLSLYNC